MMDGAETSNADYLYDDQLNVCSFVSPVKADSESSFDIYDGLDTDYQGDVAGKSKPAKDCFDLFEEILTEEGTAKDISLKEFQEKSVEREKQVEELMQKLQEVETKNSTLSNENIQLKKNISALIKTARQEIIRKDEEINRLNRRQSVNWIGNPCLRRYQNHPTGSINVPISSQNDGTYSRQSLPCPSRSANVEQCLLTPHLNEEGNCPKARLLDCGSTILEPKSQCNLPRNVKSLSSLHSVVGREHSCKFLSHTSIVPPLKPNVIKDKAELPPCKEGRGTEKSNGENSVKHGTVEKLYVSELLGSGNKHKELHAAEKTEKQGQASLSTKPHSEVSSTARHTPEERSDKVKHRLGPASFSGTCGNSAGSKESKSNVEKEERRKEKVAKKSDPRSREQVTDRKKDQKSSREEAKGKQRDDRLRSRSSQKEREPERRHCEKRKDSSKLPSPSSSCKYSRSTCVAVNHSSSKEKINQKTESKSSGKEKSTGDSRDRKSKSSNGKVQDEDTGKESVGQSGKNNSRSLNKDESKKEKGKCEPKENQRDHSVHRHSLRNGRDYVDKERQSKKDKTRVTEGHERTAKRHCTGDPAHGHGTGSQQSRTDSKEKIQESCSLSSCTLELNKENQEPLCKTGVKTWEISEEIEEGEILSEVDECASQEKKPASNVQVVKESNNEETGNPGQSPSEKETDLANPDESAVKSSTEVLPKIKSVKKRGKSKGVSSSQDSEGLKISSLSTIEKKRIKSSVTDLMEALKVARKIIRRKYMKLHKQFEIRRFKRIIEIAIAEFISIVKRSKFPKSRREHKSSICAMIEAKLSQAKSNGIVSSIFSQQAPNMKEKLWMFVEKQFDFIFDMTRETFISCDNISLELALEEERKNEKLIKSKKRKTVVKHKVDKLSKLKRSLFLEPLLANNVSSKKNSERKKLTADGSRQKESTQSNKHSKNCIELTAGGVSKENSQPSTKVKNFLSLNQMNSNASSDSLINSNFTKDSHEKTELGILTEQQASTLTFNLVSDAQMGEIFKCLLQGSDLLEQGISTLECNSWPVPEKMHHDGNSILSGATSTSEKVSTVSQGDSISWPPVTPNKHTVGLRPPLNIDILDESCMLEIPDKLVHNKDTQMISLPEGSISQKVIETSSAPQMPTSVSSILMEDLAVSLTVPSPLKSDGEISFLTSQNELSLPGEVSESILTSHYSENAVLDEEDALEQDIHLALDSDNSSSRSSNSSMWNKQMSSFQYQGHSPMQAVVTEKSNDHFIVKIRCRTSKADSPLQSSPSAPAEQKNAPSKLGPSGGCIMETIDKQTILPVNNVQGVIEEQDRLMSKSLPTHSLVVEHPADGGRTLEESGMEVGMQPSQLEKDQPLANHCADREPSLETPSGKIKGVALLTATILEPDPSSRTKKRKHNAKVDSTHKRARKESLKTSEKQNSQTKAQKKSTSSAKKAVKKTDVTPKKTTTNACQSTVSLATSLSAKNVIKKNGEVVIAWTRDDDRSILLDCQQKGANEETFSYISRKLQRSPRQVSERLFCLMKLFKRTGNMNN
ncbi:CASP8-associated protein 2 isoform X2 [Rhinoraja longicauda]